MAKDRGDRWVLVRDISGHQKTVFLRKPKGLEGADADGVKEGTPCRSITTDERATIKFGKMMLPRSLLSSAEFYTSYRQEGPSTWVAAETEEAGAPDEENYVDDSTNNRTLEDDPTANTQKLSAAEILALKEDGGSKGGVVVVEAIAQNSATFALKTKFAQEKYLRKKRQRHLKQITVLPSNLRNLSEAYYSTDHRRIHGLRFDVVSTMVGFCDVRVGTRALVLDQSCGLLTTGMLQCMSGGDEWGGSIFRIGGNCLGSKIVEESGFKGSPLIKDVPVTLLELILEKLKKKKKIEETELAKHPWLRIPPQHLLIQMPDDQTTHEPTSHPEKATPDSEKATPDPSPAENNGSHKRPHDEIPSSPSRSDPSSPPPRKKFCPDVTAKRRRLENVFDLIKNGVETVMMSVGSGVVRRHDQAPHEVVMSGTGVPVDDLLLDTCLELLIPGETLASSILTFCHSDGKVAFYCLDAMTCIKVQSRLMSHPAFVAVRMEELLMREYQVLAGRTHPLMSPSIRHFSGFLVTAYRVDETS